MAKTKKQWLPKKKQESKWADQPLTELEKQWAFDSWRLVEVHPQADSGRPYTKRIIHHIIRVYGKG